MLHGMTDFDVIVVGAGTAGLSAAAELRALGKSCIVLEATGRIGGRAFTETPAALDYAPFDLGATWLHAAERNPLVAIARAHGDTLINADEIRGHRTFIDGQQATEADLAALHEAQLRFERIANARLGAGGDVSFAEALAPLRDDPWTATIETWEAAMIAAADPQDFSLQDWHENELAGANLVVEGGIGRFVTRRLGPPAGEVRLRTPARRIAWQQQGGAVSVETPQGTLGAHTCIVTVSTGVLASGGLAFDPALPGDIQEAAGGLPMGLLTKVGLQAAGADRLGLAPNTLLQRRVDRPGEPVMFFMAWPFGADYLAGFVGGPAAWELARQGEQATEAFAREQLRLLLGSRVDGALAGAVVSSWGTDPAYRGAYAYARTGHVGARAVLAQPLGDGTLAFAGEAVCTDGLAGTVGGAYLSGVRAARTVLGVRMKRET